ncbi:MAG: 4Fe-4S dicluster domain-containing protein [Bacillota bacterium]
MRQIEEELRIRAASLLESGEVSLVIGYAQGSEASRTTPAFIKKAEEAGKLVFNSHCVNNLAKYLADNRNMPGKVAVVVKGCDSRAVNRLIQDNQVERERIVLLGAPCPGMVEAESAEEFLMEKCRRCENRNPVIYDYLAGEKVAEEGNKDFFDDVRSIEGLSVQEKSLYWDRQFARCLRCYACRNVCPACTCRECVFDQAQPEWVAMANNLSDNTAFHLVRAFHVAGRCVDCGECQRVCPVNIPLSVLNRKILSDIRDLYGVSTPGQTMDETSVLGGFHKGDPDEFM